MQESRKRYLEKSIKEINKDDRFVVIAGYPIKIKENLILLDDGDSSMPIYLNEIKINETAKFIRVFGSILEIEGRLTLQLDFIQDLSRIDRFLYDKIKTLFKS